jgi:F-type H+-transporting ATPase subunit delta
MAEISTIARPYAEAIFEIADKAGALAQWSATLGNLAAAAEHPDVRQLLGNPRVSSSALIDMFAAVSGDSSSETRKLLETLTANQRIAALPSIHEQFEALKNERESTVDAIGGARITVGDQVIDGSVRGKLAAMAASLTAA